MYFLVKEQIKKSHRNVLPVCDLDVLSDRKYRKYIDIYEMYFLSESTSLKFQVNYLH